MVTHSAHRTCAKEREARLIEDLEKCTEDLANTEHAIAKSVGEEPPKTGTELEKLHENLEKLKLKQEVILLLLRAAKMAELVPIEKRGKGNGLYIFGVLKFPLK